MVKSMLHTTSTAHREIVVTAGGVELPGMLAIPAGATGIVAFAHGSGSSGMSPRSAGVARMLEDARLATLRFDLLTPVEADNRTNVFDIPLLAGRLAAATSWLHADEELSRLPLGYFGASTGAAAALWAAADERRVRAVVSRGGRPDLARSRLSAVRAPTLLIVGGLDTVVLDLNEEARLFLHCECELRLVPGATHLFEEPGTLDAAGRLARDWFLTHLR
jgi:putative phosphoribosyl transferase